MSLPSLINAVLFSPDKRTLFNMGIKLDMYQFVIREVRGIPAHSSQPGGSTGVSLLTVYTHLLSGLIILTTSSSKLSVFQLQMFISVLLFHFISLHLCLLKQMHRALLSLFLMGS